MTPAALSRVGHAYLLPNPTLSKMFCARSFSFSLNHFTKEPHSTYFHNSSSDLHSYVFFREYFLKVFKLFRCNLKCQNSSMLLENNRGVHHNAKN